MVRGRATAIEYFPKSETAFIAVALPSEMRGNYYLNLSEDSWSSWCCNAEEWKLCSFCSWSIQDTQTADEPHLVSKYEILRMFAYLSAWNRLVVLEMELKEDRVVNVLGDIPGEPGVYQRVVGVVIGSILDLPLLSKIVLSCCLCNVHCKFFWVYVGVVATRVSQWLWESGYNSPIVIHIWNKGS